MKQVKIAVHEDDSILIDNNGDLIAFRPNELKKNPLSFLTELLNCVVPAVRNKSTVELISVGGIFKIEW